VAAETDLTGQTSFAILAGGQSYDAQSWGNSFAFATGAGMLTADTSQSLTVSLRGQMAAATSDSVVLRNFTVLRYPAQSNP
jgi:aconitase B